MRIQTEEWQRFVPGVRMYKDKKTLFYNGENLWDGEGFGGQHLIHDWQERQTWEVIIVLPGVEVIPEWTFFGCKNVEKVIMADSARRIEYKAFFDCGSLLIVRLSRSLEFIGKQAFLYCASLPFIFIPPSCREIATFAFERCKKLIILGLPQTVELGAGVFKKTAVLDASPFDFVEDCYSRINNDEIVRGRIILQRIDHDADKEEEAVQWIRSINDGDAYALHCVCSSFDTLPETTHGIIKQHGIKALSIPNSIGITPSQYLAANMFADISEKDIINRYVLDMMGEEL